MIATYFLAAIGALVLGCGSVWLVAITVTIAGEMADIGVRRPFEILGLWSTVRAIAIRARKRTGVSGLPFTREMLLKAEADLLSPTRDT